jgi:hypothetical protein
MEAGVKLYMKGAALVSADGHRVDSRLRAGAGCDDAFDYQVRLAVIAHGKISTDDVTIDYIA